LAVKRLNFRREDGVAMTEFALILPIFMVIVAGLLGFGRVFFYWIQANHVANETARWAIVDRNPYAPTTLQQHAANSSSVEFNSGSDQTTVCIQRDGTSLNLGDPLDVTVAKPFAFVPILGIGKITIRASSTMRVERLGAVDASNNAIPSSYTEGCGT
jgi:Flp pilus assembly protein TadG